MVHICKIQEHLWQWQVLKIRSISHLSHELGLSLFSYRVIKWTLNTSLAFLILASLSLVLQRVIFLFLPPVATLASCHLFTPLVVFGYEGAWSPALANLIAVITEDVWLTSEVLIIVSVHTLSFVVFFVKWAPFCFEVEHVEIWVFLHLMDQSNF